LGFGLRSNDAFLKAHPYTLFDALRNLSINVVALNWESVLFLFLFLLLVLINEKNEWDVILFATVSTIIFLHIFYHFRSIRYYYVSFFLLFLLAARGINLAEVSIKKFLPDISIKNLNYFFLLFILISNIVIISPPQKVVKRYELYQRLKDPFNLVEKSNLRNAVVFLRTVPEGYNNISYYVQNPLDFSGDVLFVRDLKERNSELMNYYPEKEFYIYEFDRLKKSGKLTRLK
jgi:signal transduction histidine kinase